MSSTAVPVHEPTTVRAALRSPRVLRTEVLAGLVVALALIPEAISFSIIAGVDPRVGLFASFTMAVAISFLGGRPAMISAATGAIALVIAPVMREHGYDYLIATVLLGGAIQVVLALVGVARLMRFVPRSVMVGFVNALAILIFQAQLTHLVDVPWLVYPMVAVGIAVIVGFPRVNAVVPAPLVAIVALTGFTLLASITVPDVGDQGTLPDSLPSWFLPDVPLTLDTLRIIAPYALAMAVVGLLESLLTAKLVDDITDTPSDKTREAVGQGAANVITGFFGGMGGCAMIGQTMINVKVSGARTRISTFLAGVFLLVLVVGFGDVVALIPMAALVAVMMMVSVGTFDWHSVRPATLRRMPRSETAVMHRLQRRRRDHDRHLPCHRAAVLRLEQRAVHAVRLRRRPGTRRRRPLGRAGLGRLDGGRARRDHDEVRPAWLERRHRRARPGERGAARAPDRSARWPLSVRAVRHARRLRRAVARRAPAPPGRRSRRPTSRAAPGRGAPPPPAP